MVRTQSLALTAVGGLLLAAVFLSGERAGRSSARAEPPRDDAAVARPELAPVLLAQKEPAPPAKTGDKPAAPDMGWIGLMLEETKDGALVKSVFPAGPAAFAGIRAGDVLAKVGETAIDAPARAAEAIEKLPPQKPATITVRRGDKPLELTVNVGSLNEFHERYTHEMLRRDPRDRNFAQHHGISEADMSVELVRRLFEQNQRMETTLHQVLTEVQALRTELNERKK